MIEDLTQTFEESEKSKKDEEETDGKPDPLTQLVTTFCRGAMTERSGALQEDLLYMSYAQIAAKSCGEEEEEGGDEEGGEGGEEGEGTSIHVSFQRIHHPKPNALIIPNLNSANELINWLKLKCRMEKLMVTTKNKNFKNTIYYFVLLNMWISLFY